MMTAGDYLNTVAQMNGLTFRAMAKALKVDPAVLRRWRRGRAAPSWRRVQAMTALWGGNPYVIFLGSMLERYCQQTGTSFEEARRLLSGRPAGPRRKSRAARVADRAQLQLPITRD
jgi:transcriptional regulator with XRE-family HTH domain